MRPGYVTTLRLMDNETPAQGAGGFGVYPLLRGPNQLVVNSIVDRAKFGDALFVFGFVLSLCPRALLLECLDLGICLPGGAPPVPRGASTPLRSRRGVKPRLPPKVAALAKADYPPAQIEVMLKV